MSRAPARAILLLLCGTLAWAHSGCASRSRGATPVPDPNLASTSPAPPSDPGAAGSAATAYARPATPQRWSEAMRKAREDLRLGRLEAAEESLLAALEATRSMRPRDVRIEVTLANLQRLAESYRLAKRPEDFIRVAKRVVSITPRQSDRPGLATMLTQLGRLHLRRGETDEAAASFERALEIRTRTEGGEAASVISLYGQLSRVEIARKNLAGASLLIERAIEIQESSGRTESALFVAGLVDLATLRSSQGRDGDAIPILRRALEISRSLGLERTGKIADQLLQLQSQQDDWDPEASPDSAAP